MEYQISSKGVDTFIESPIAIASYNQNVEGERNSANTLNVFTLLNNLGHKDSNSKPNLKTLKGKISLKRKQLRQISKSAELAEWVSKGLQFDLHPKYSLFGSTIALYESQIYWGKSLSILSQIESQSVGTVGRKTKRSCRILYNGLLKSQHLTKICKNNGNKETLLLAQAYSNWMGATFYMLSERYVDALYRCLLSHECLWIGTLLLVSPKNTDLTYLMSYFDSLDSIHRVSRYNIARRGVDIPDHYLLNTQHSVKEIMSVQSDVPRHVVANSCIKTWRGVDLYPFSEAVSQLMTSLIEKQKTYLLTVDFDDDTSLPSDEVFMSRFMRKLDTLSNSGYEEIIELTSIIMTLWKEEYLNRVIKSDSFEKDLLFIGTGERSLGHLCQFLYFYDTYCFLKMELNVVKYLQNIRKEFLKLNRSKGNKWDICIANWDKASNHINDFVKTAEMLRSRDKLFKDFDNYTPREHLSDHIANSTSPSFYGLWLWDMMGDKESLNHMYMHSVSQSDVIDGFQFHCETLKSVCQSVSFLNARKYAEGLVVIRFAIERLEKKFDFCDFKPMYRLIQIISYLLSYIVEMAEQIELEICLRSSDENVNSVIQTVQESCTSAFNSSVKLHSSATRLISRPVTYDLARQYVKPPNELLNMSPEPASVSEPTATTSGFIKKFTSWFTKN